MLQSQEIDGAILATMTEEKFRSDGFPRGPSSKLFEGVKKLFPQRFPGPVDALEDVLAPIEIPFSRTLDPLQSGANPMYAPHAPRLATLEKLERMMVSQRVAYLVGPPFSGKTSLATLFGIYCRSKGLQAYYVNCTQFATLDEAFEKTLGKNVSMALAQKSPMMILVDDIQQFFADQVAHQSFWPLIKAHEASPPIVKLLFFATAKLYPSGLSPFRFSCRLESDLLWMSDEDEKDLVNDFNTLSKFKVTPDLALQLRQYLGRHFGFWRQALYGMSKENVSSDDEAILFLNSSRFFHLLRGIRIAPMKPTLDASLVQALSDLLVRGPLDVLSEVNSPYDKLESQGIVTWTSKGVDFVSPVMRSLILRTVYSPEKPSVVLASSLPELVYLVLTSFSPNSLNCTLSYLQSGNRSEALYKFEFYRHALKFLPQSLELGVEVGSVFGQKGRIDFYIDGDTQWLLEFLVGGSKLQEHIDRFEEPSGTYKDFPKKDWLVVDLFQSSSGLDSPPTMWPLEANANFMGVLISPDCEMIAIYHKSRTPRILTLNASN